MNHLQRSISLAITGASRTTPQLALEIMLFLPNLETYIQTEARVTALRYQYLIQRRYPGRNDHSSIIDEVHKTCSTLRVPVDRLISNYVFDRLFRVEIPTSETWDRTYDGDNPLIIRWFTDTSFTNKASGYGFYNPCTGASHCGPLGSDAESTQADISVIFMCCIEIKNTAVSNDPIHIYTNSLGAIKALNSYRVESKLALECVEILNDIARHRRITLVWIPITHTECSAKANTLAKEGASMTPYGPAPFLPTTEKKCRRACQSWAIGIMEQSWQNTTHCSHAKTFINSPDMKFTDQILKLNKARMNITVGLVTGHIRLNRYLNVLGLRDDPDCDRCGGGAETAKHFLCDCPGYTNLRRSIFGCDLLDPREAVKSHIHRLFNFAQGSRRFPSMKSEPTPLQTLTGSRNRHTGNNAVSPVSLRPQQQTIG